MQTAIALPNSTAIPPVAAYSEISDEALIDAIGHGNKRAMSVFYARHSVRTYRFILRITSLETFAEDLVHEVFLEVWRHAAQFEGRAQVSTWLLAIARNKALSALRKRQDDELDETALELQEDPADRPDVILEKNQRAALLRRCLAQLSPAHREIIDLVYYHEKSVEEAAKIIGIPQPTVKTRMFYARKQLAERIKELEPESVH
jgi:RNA polymerase sigma-70 factor (ECF subfamily)